MRQRLIHLTSQIVFGFMPLAAMAQPFGLPMSCPGCTLQGIDFNSASMGDKSFTNSNLSKADLRRANLSNMYMLTTNLQGADLRGADLRHTFFTGSSNFRDADLRGANLLDVWFTDADLRGADLRGTNVELIKTLEGADLRGAKVDANFYGRVMADQPYGICLSNTTLPNGKIIQNSCKFR